MEHIRGVDRSQTLLLPSSLEDYVPAECPARFIDAYVDGLDFQKLGFARSQPASTGRPSYHPADLLKLYLYGYLNRNRSSRRLEAEAGRNLELIWLLRGLRPDFKTIADFRKDNRDAFLPLFKQFNLLCR
jgi:transposase